MNKNSIKEDIERLKLCSTNQCNICGRYEKEECMLERNRCEQHILSEYKRVLKENEELLQEKIDNQKINLLAQNFMLDYQKGYEDGKANRGSAVQIIIDNQQYHIFRNQIEKYKEHIEKLQKENEELKEERQIVGIPVRNKRDGRIGIVLHQWESGSVAVLESINPRVINTHDSWNTLEIVTDEVKQTQTKCETIPVQKIKDKIEELKERKMDIVTSPIHNADEKIEILKKDKIRIQVLQELLESEE